MKENCIPFVFLYKKCYSCIIIFLIFGLLLLPAWTSSTTISNHSELVPNTTNINCNSTDWIQRLILIVVVLSFISCNKHLCINNKPEHYGPVPYSANANSSIPDQIHILILTQVGCTFIISVINLYINYNLIQILILILVGLNFIMSAINLSSNYKHDYCGWVEIVILVQVGPTLIICSFINDQRIHRKKHDAEQGELQESNRKLQELIEQCQKELEWRKARNNIDDITLAADTAHPNLSIAGDKKRLKHETQPQKVPQTRERFDSTVCVLGSQGFSSGKHYWEVDVESSTDWDLGVARKSIERKGKLSLSPKEGFWVLGFSGRDYWAKTDPWTRVMVQKNSKKIGVYLNYQERQVTFYNVTDMSVLFTFSDCSFSGEVCPFFKNSHKDTTLKICSIKEEE